MTDADKEPTREKYILDERDESTWTGIVAADGSLKLKVYFRRQYTITYDPNGGTINGSPESVEEKHFYGEQIKIIAAPKRTGYTFQYWKGSRYMPGDKYTVKDDHTFVAQWKKYDPNVPQTGDETHLGLWASVLLLSASAFTTSTILALPRRRYGKRH